MKETSFRGILALASITFLAACHGSLSESDLLGSGVTAQELQQVIKQIRARTNPNDNIPRIVAELRSGDLSDLEGMPPNLTDLVGPEVESVEFNSTVGPEITSSGAGQSVEGGTVTVTLRSAPSPNPSLPPNEFNFVFVTIEGDAGQNTPDGYYVLRIDGDPADPDLDSVVEVELFITLPADVPFSDFDCTYRAGLVTVPSGSDMGPLVIGGAATDPIEIKQIDTGPLQATLTWTSGADLDLRVFDPQGREIAFEGANESLGVTAQGTGGADCATPGGELFFETLTWGVARVGIPDPIVGDYTAVIVNEDGCAAGETDFALTILTGGEIQQVIGDRVAMGDMETVEFQYPFRTTLRLGKEIDNPNPSEFETVLLTTTITNAGGSQENNATGVQLIDNVPVGLNVADPAQDILVSAGQAPTVSNEPDGSLRVEWNLGDLDKGDSATMTLQADVEFGAATQPQPLVNQASATADQAELELTQITVDVADNGFVDLAVTKAVDRLVANELDAVEFTIDVVNREGSADATQIVVGDPLPAGLTFVFAMASQGAFDPSTGLWNVGPLASGDSAHLSLIAEVDAGTSGQTLVNTVSVTSANDDPFPGNDSDFAELRVNQAPLADAGPDQTVTDTAPAGSESVMLNGSMSSDADGTIQTYEWSEAGTLIGTGPTPTVSLTTGEHTITLTVSDDNGGQDDDEVVITVNAPPVANAGPDQTVEDDDGSGGESITLNGTGSSDPEGPLASYVWSEGGNTLGTGATLNVTLAVGQHDITLTVADADGATATDQVRVTVLANVPPVANAGPDQSINDLPPLGTELVTLDGSGSTDPGAGTIVSYEWLNDGVVFATGVTTTVNLQVGTYSFDLRVTDNGGATDLDDVLITINEAPSADAGEDLVVYDSDGSGAEVVTLDGNGSNDPDGSIVSYVWREGGSVIGTGPTPSVTLSVGVHTIVLTVTDDDGASGSDQMIVDVRANRPPVADAGPDQTVTDTAPFGSQLVNLNGLMSFDPDQTPLTYAWFDSGGNQIATGPTPSVSLPVGVNTITLRVTDAGGASGTDGVEIDVNGPPVADAGPDQDLFDDDGNGRELVTFDGSGSFDPDGVIVSYAWVYDGETFSSQEIWETDLGVGAHTFRLDVTDNDGLTDSDFVTITVNPNQVPVARAGPDQNLIDVDPFGEEPVTLDGSASSDPDGSIVLYRWGIVSDNQFLDIVAPSASPTVTLDFPVGTFTITLRVTDNGGATDDDSLTVTVTNVAPVIGNEAVGVIQLNDDALCTLSTPFGTSFEVLFDYSDGDGDGPTNIAEARLDISWLFRNDFGGSGDPGGFTDYQFASSLGGNGFAGSAITTQCYRFGNWSSVDVTMTIVDGAGNRSNALVFNIPRPPGSN